MKHVQRNPCAIRTQFSQTSRRRGEALASRASTRQSLDCVLRSSRRMIVVDASTVLKKWTIAVRTEWWHSVYGDERRPCFVDRRYAGNRPVDCALARAAASAIALEARAVKGLGDGGRAPWCALGSVGAAREWRRPGAVLLRHCIRLRSIRREGHVHGRRDGFRVRDPGRRGRDSHARRAPGNGRSSLDVWALVRSDKGEEGYCSLQYLTGM